MVNSQHCIKFTESTPESKAYVQFETSQWALKQ